MADSEAIVFTLSYPEEQAKSAATVPTDSEGEIGGIHPALPAIPENIKYARSSARCHGRIKGLSVNDGGWYFPPPNPNKSGGGKGRRNRVCTSIEYLFDIVS